MTGAIIQLVAKGIQDIFITENPQITYFKIIYRRHTNFSSEEIPQFFTHKPNFGKKVSCKLSASGDLIGKTYLVITLPTIKPFYLDDGTIDPYLKFAWVRKIGFSLIKTIDIEFNGEIIDKHYGEWLNIATELFTRKLDKGIDKMIGNIEKLYTFTQTKDKYTLYIPLHFWFCKHSSLSIPISCLHHCDVKINLELNEFESCYLLNPTNYIEIDDDLVTFTENDYITQTVDNQVAVGQFSSYDPLTKRLYYRRISKNKFISPTSDLSLSQQKNYIISSGYKYVYPKIDVNSKLYYCKKLDDVNIKECYLLVNYIYLDSDERNRIIQNKHDYLIEQLQIFNTQTISSSNFIAKADSVNPSRYFVWVVQQQYLTEKYNNDFFNYTDSYIYNNNTQMGKSLVNTENIIFNGHDRISEQTYKYFNYMQILKHFKQSVTEGYNVYSFCISPDLFNPSGASNMTNIPKCQIKMSLSNIINDNNNALFRGYSVSQNIFRISDGICGSLFINN
jgi:hypothetical protein